MPSASDVSAGLRSRRAHCPQLIISDEFYKPSPRPPAERLILPQKALAIRVVRAVHGFLWSFWANTSTKRRRANQPERSVRRRCAAVEYQLRTPPALFPPLAKGGFGGVVPASHARERHQSRPLDVHLDALWRVLQPHVLYLKGLKEHLSVDVYCSYYTNCSTGGFEIDHRSLVIFTELEIPFGLSVGL